MIVAVIDFNENSPIALPAAMMLVLSLLTGRIVKRRQQFHYSCGRLRSNDFYGAYCDACVWQIADLRGKSVGPTVRRRSNGGRRLAHFHFLAFVGRRCGLPVGERVAIGPNRIYRVKRAVSGKERASVRLFGGGHASPDWRDRVNMEETPSQRSMLVSNGIGRV